VSGIENALLINALVLAVVLEADLGPHRKIGWFRVARPIVTAALIVPFFLEGFTRSGTGLLVEVAATVAGLLLGLAAGALMRIYRSPRTGRPVSRAGFGYAALWTVVIGARVAFSYGSSHWFGPQFGHWTTAHSVTTAAITDSLIFMAMAMLIARTLSLGLRAAGLPRATGVGTAPVLQRQA
jgi:hypothetical protein